MYRKHIKKTLNFVDTESEVFSVSVIVSIVVILWWYEYFLQYPVFCVYFLEFKVANYDREIKDEMEIRVCEF